LDAIELFLNNKFIINLNLFFFMVKDPVYKITVYYKTQLQAPFLASLIKFNLNSILGQEEANAKSGLSMFEEMRLGSFNNFFSYHVSQMSYLLNNNGKDPDWKIVLNVKFNLEKIVKFNKKMMTNKQREINLFGMNEIPTPKEFRKQFDPMLRQKILNHLSFEHGKSEHIKYIDPLVRLFFR